MPHNDEFKRSEDELTVRRALRCCPGSVGIRRILLQKVKRKTRKGIRKMVL